MEEHAAGYSLGSVTMIKRIEYVLDTLGAAAIIALCLLIVLSVVGRELVGSGVPDSIILVRELMVPAILFPLSTATARRAHISIEVIANHFPAGLNRWVAVLAAFVGLVIVGTLIAASWVQLAKTFSEASHYGGDFLIPKWPSRAAYFLAFVFVGLRLLQIFWIDLRAAIRGQDAPATL